MRVDLHTHSSISDGTESPAGVMRSAAAAGLDVVALTDHDSLAGWGEARAAADGLGLRFVPGVEVSCRRRGISVHLLAYWPDAGDAEVAEMMARTREARIARAREIVGRVARDHPISWEDVVVRAEAAETVGRPHIADALVEAGVVPSRDAAFGELLHSGSPYYVPHYAPDVLDAIRTLRAAGGVTVFAHPGAEGRGRVVASRVIREMTGAGLVGLEVDHRDHSVRQRERLAALAGELSLVRTGASDYHGAGKRNRLGENTTTVEALAALERAHDGLSRRRAAEPNA